MGGTEEREREKRNVIVVVLLPVVAAAAVPADEQKESEASSSLEKLRLRRRSDQGPQGPRLWEEPAVRAEGDRQVRPGFVEVLCRQTKKLILLAPSSPRQ